MIRKVRFPEQWVHVYSMNEVNVNTIAMTDIDAHGGTSYSYE